ncbi:MAG: laccase domain-containing protein, partial [Oscillospiraceae bacterium]|nr:laccase domain-containing protein [Oscillospiraceae bacterium]
MMDYFTENMRGEQFWMTADNLDWFPNVVHAFTTREGGVSEGIYSSLNLGFNRGDDPEKVEENYRLICSAIGVDPHSIVATRQIHSDIVRKVGAADKRENLSDPVPYEADALITNEPDVTLAVFIADCIPVLLYAEDSVAIGAVHAGWRGTAADIVGKAVSALCSEYGGSPANIVAAIGEGIGKCCFETGPEVYEAIAALGLECPMDAVATDDGNGKYHIDLKEVNRQLLMR